MIHVLHLETGKSLFGGGLQVAYLIERLALDGVHNGLIADRRSGLGQQLESSLKQKILRPFRGELDPEIGIQLMRYLAHHRVDILHVHSRRGADFWGPLISSMTGIPLILTRRVDNPQGSIAGQIRYGMANRVVGISEKISDVVRSIGIEPRKVQTIRSGVDLEVNQPCVASGWLHREFALEDEVPLIGMVAQFIPRKGHFRFLEILKLAQQQVPGLQGILFGKGPLEAEVRERAAGMDLASTLHFAGFRSDLPRCLPELVCVVHPAEMEGLGVSLLQAAACAVPVVGSARGGIPEIILDGKTGYLHEPDDLSGFAESVNSLCLDKALRDQLAIAARKRMEVEFGMEVMATKNLRHYEDLLRSI